jgi:hypothetical protein
VKKPFKHGGKRRSGEMSRDPTVMPKWCYIWRLQVRSQY